MDDWRLKALANLGLQIILREFGKSCVTRVASRYGMPTQPNFRLKVAHNGGYSVPIMDDGSVKFSFIFSYPVPNHSYRNHSTDIECIASIADSFLTISEVSVAQGSFGSLPPGGSLIPNPHDKDPSGINWTDEFREWSRGEGKTCMDEYWKDIPPYLSQLKQK